MAGRVSIDGPTRTMRGLSRPASSDDTDMTRLHSCPRLAAEDFAFGRGALAKLRSRPPRDEAWHRVARRIPTSAPDGTPGTELARHGATRRGQAKPDDPRGRNPSTTVLALGNEGWHSRWASSPKQAHHNKLSEPTGMASFGKTWNEYSNT